MSPEKSNSDRQPWAAGKFYPSDPSILKAELDSLFKVVYPIEYEDVIAVISPHAGYYFSGSVAAQAFAKIDRDKKFEHVFVIASSHHYLFEGASIYSGGNYRTPLGTVHSDLDLVAALQHQSPLFRFGNEYHQDEHSLEVQLPFLQFWLKNEINVIPILIGTSNPAVCKQIASALQPYFNEHNLFVISTDFSHYPSDSDARVVDENTANAIIANNPETLSETLLQNTKHGYANLSTSLCGYTSVLTLLNMTKNLDNIHFHKIKYKNSGEVEQGDKKRVVGYWAITVSKISDQKFTFSDHEKDTLLAIARKTLIEDIRFHRKFEVAEKGLPDQLLKPLGAFVTLKNNGKLRGCIGTFEPERPLFQVVQQMTVSAAKHDHRFTPVQVSELDSLQIEISVLSPLKKISDVSEIELGKHGIYLVKGKNSGTFLPQVALQTGWDLEEFLGHCARDKAQIGWFGWKDADIYIYEAMIIEE